MTSNLSCVTFQDVPEITDMNIYTKICEFGSEHCAKFITVQMSPSFDAKIKGGVLNAIRYSLQEDMNIICFNPFDQCEVGDNKLA